MNVVKNYRNSGRYFERLSAGSLAQNSVCLAMNAVAIIVKGCSRVFGLLATGKSDSYVTMAAVH